MSVNMCDANGNLTRVDCLPPEWQGAGYHNSIFRGKYLGSSVAQAQWDAIADGSFTDLYVGDYWTINSINWRIAACDYFLHKGDTECTTHHIVIVPDKALLGANGSSSTYYMSTTNVTTGGYKGSGFHSGTNPAGTVNNTKSICISVINNAFGSGHILTHRERLTDTVTSGKPTNTVWEDCDVEYMSEVMAFGHNIWASAPGYESMTELTQFPLFALRPDLIYSNTNWWLRDIYNETTFSSIYYTNFATATAAGNNWFNCRPYFALKAV